MLPLKNLKIGSILGRELGFVCRHGGIIAGLLLLAACFGLVIWVFHLVWSGTSNWLGTISDPTERGLAYIALAIAFHAVAGKSNVDVKVDGKQP